MSVPPDLPALEVFAAECLAAERFPDDYHVFTPKECPGSCGLRPLEVEVRHHAGSEEHDFTGEVLGRCPRCGTEGRVLAILSGDRTVVREERPVCACGGRTFYVAEMERIEGDEGLPGFFDEGVLIGQCAACGRYRVFVHTD